MLDIASVRRVSQATSQRIGSERPFYLVSRSVIPFGRASYRKSCKQPHPHLGMRETSRTGT